MDNFQKLWIPLWITKKPICIVKIVFSLSRDIGVFTFNSVGKIERVSEVPTFRLPTVECMKSSGFVYKA